MDDCSWEEGPGGKPRLTAMRVRVCDAADGREIHALTVAPEVVRALTFSPDDGALAVLDATGQVTVHDLTGRIAQVHAKDGRRATASRAAREVALGAGDIDWLRFLESLQEIEYRGWLTVERETGDNRVADVASGVAFLRRLIG